MTRIRTWTVARTLLVALPLALGACASSGPQSPTATTDDMDRNNDPLENVNRKIWAFDIALNHYLLHPITSGYRDVTPDFIQTAIRNVLRNIKTPTIMLNDLLQGNFGQLRDSSVRLILNTTLGLGGFIDVGTKAKFAYHESDFGQTLGSWGVGPGPYIVLPLLGPSDPRDGIGYAVDSFADPFSIEMRAHGFEEGNYVRLGVGIISDQAERLDEFDELEKSSLDFYAAARSLYQQQRVGEVNRAKNGGVQPPPAAIDQDDTDMPTPSQSPVQSSTPGKAP